MTIPTAGLSINSLPQGAPWLFRRVPKGVAQSSVSVQTPGAKPSSSPSGWLPTHQELPPVPACQEVPKTLPRRLLHEKGNYWSGDTRGFWAEEHMLSLPLTGSHCCCVKNKLQGARAAARRPVKSLLMCRWKIDGVCTGGEWQRRGDLRSGSEYIAQVKKEKKRSPG